MLYLGHFSFSGRRDGEKVVHGVFTCAVEADHVEASLEKFRELLKKRRNDTDFLDGIHRIYLDGVTEIKEIPAEGLLAHFQLSRGDMPDNENIALPGVDERYGASFVYTPASTDEEGAYQMEPFISFP